MASNKNQHYVPQCYLKNFAIDELKAAICLYNLDRKRLIKNAPIKNQCSKNYFYGEDLALEKALQPIEGQFSEMVRTIDDSNYILTEKDELFFKHFWLLQYLRTEAASKRNVELVEDLRNTADVPELKMELKEAVQQSMRTFFNVKNIVNDLKVCIFRNNTKTSFITSDDPAVLTNRWHLLNKKAGFQSFGLGSAGSLLVLPLTPKLLMLAYDADVYHIPNIKQCVRIKNSFDVDAFNYLQILHCRANLYTENINSLQYLQSLYNNVKDIKPAQSHRINYAVLDKVDNDTKTFKVVDFAEAGKHEQALIHCEPISIAPPIWSRFIHYKHRGFVMTDGSALGFVRKARINEFGGNGFYKVPIHKS